MLSKMALAALGVTQPLWILEKLCAEMLRESGQKPAMMATATAAMGAMLIALSRRATAAQEETVITRTRVRRLVAIARKLAMRTATMATPTTRMAVLVAAQPRRTISALVAAQAPRTAVPRVPVATAREHALS